MKHECLHPDELPTLGTLVAIDAEFVSMQQVGYLYTAKVVNQLILECRKKPSTVQTGLRRYFGPQD